ncbi:hypothetical protein, partial [Aquabacterium lacunae]|uniref:hypothetical protein n=1 Tax=Aquabacterium lacunae TaxID=2528630 RepID=UPI0013EF270B
KARIKRNYAGDFLIEDSTEALNEKQREILLKNVPFALKILNRGDRYLINNEILTFPEYPPPISRFSLTSTAVVSGASAIVDSIGAPAALYFDCLTKNFSGSNGDDVKILSKIAEEYFNTEYAASKNNAQHLKNSRSKIMKDMLSTKLGKAFMSRTVGKLLGCPDVEEFEATGNF